MNLNNADKNMRLRAQITNQKLKQNAQTQDADGMQAFFCVKNDAISGYISTTVRLMRREVPSPRPPYFR